MRDSAPKPYPLKLNILLSTRPVEVGNSLNLFQMEVLKYFIPHEGQISIMEDGSIEIVNQCTKTIIPVEEGRKDDFREVINSRVTQAEKLTNLVKDHAVGAVISVAGKTVATLATGGTSNCPV